MASWFGRRLAPSPAAPADELTAYREGRRDERRRTDEESADSRPSRANLRAAYDRGRRDEALRRRGSGFMSLIVGLLAILAVAGVAMAIHYGSFGAAGAAADAALGSVAQRAGAPVRSAEDQAGSALENAGGRLKQKAGP